MLPRRDQVPPPHANSNEFRGFVHKFDPTLDFRRLWGADFIEQADTLDELLNAQMQAGNIIPDAPLENLLLSFCRLWTMAPYLGIDSVEAFLRHPRALWLLEGIRYKAL